MKKLLVLCFFPAFTPPVSGGELRLFNMYKRLSERFEVSLVSWTYEQSRFEIVRHSPNLREYRVPKDSSFAAAYDSCHRAGITGELAGVVCAMVGRGDTQYHKVVAELAADADAVVHEFPYTLLYDRDIGLDGKPRFYNSHNLESEMVTSLVHGGRAQEAIDLVAHLERSLAAQSRLVFATSSEELLKFRLLYGVSAEKLRLAPNGFSPADFDFERPATETAELYALFMGSQHPPNIESARFIVETLAPQFPQQRFVLAGRVCQSFSWAPDNVQLLGEVSSEEKKTLFQRAGFFVNPIFAGAGTSLKMVEAMAAGLPIVTTTAGARGLGLSDTVNALFAEREGFATATGRLIQDAALRRTLGSAARRAAFERFSWVGIGQAVANEIERAITVPAAGAAPRPLVLVVNDYSVRNAVSGGSKRIHSLLREVGKQRDVALLCLHGKPVVEVEELAPGFTEIRVPKTDEQKAFESGVNGSNWISINDIASSLFCLQNAWLVRLFRRISDNAGSIVFSHPYMAPLLEVMGAPRAVIYESHNVEADMKADILKPHHDGEILSAFVRRLEDYMHERSNAVMTVTTADRMVLEARRPGIPGTVVLNGCEVLPLPQAQATATQRDARDLSAGFRAVFVGSGHPPNIEAAKMLCTKVLPRFPNMQLWVIGSAGESLDAFAALPGLRRFGVVSDREKHDLLLQADIALNPVVSGGGSNLKLSDYFGYALPTVSTADGVRGFDVRHGEHLLVAQDAEQFVQAIADLVADRGKRATLAAGGYGFACNHLDWRQLGRRYEEVLNAVESTMPGPAAPLAKDRGPRVLVVTYRYTEPCLGGAEEYLVRLLKRYAELTSASIDLVAPNVGHISNLHHFVSDYKTAETKPEQLFAPFLNRIDLFPATAFDASMQKAAAERLSQSWMAEQRRLGRQSIGMLAASSLLGGWHGLEIHEQNVQCWSSEHAEIYIAAGASNLRLTGWHPGPVDIDLQIDDEPPARLMLQDDFSFDMLLTPETGHRISLAMPARTAGPNDVRRIGILLKRLEVVQGRQGVWQRVPLEQSFDAFWRENDAAGWIDALRNVAQARSEADEEAFLHTRGPRSPDLVEHVRKVAGRYDLVLLQGVPFSNSVDVVQAVRDADVPLLLLPHYHVDDAFYHWRQYYDAFAKADAVLSFSHWVNAHFFDKLGVTAPIIAGGGVEPAEYLARGHQLEQFQQFRGSDRPYFLVLGRKTGSKGYRTIIKAHQQLLHSQKLDVDLVLIGPDEDRQPVEGTSVHYYGRLSRELTLGALAGCVALVTMSASESFGIVLIEAWMSGRPVIANKRCLSFTELIEEGTDGFLVGNVTELSEAMRILVNNPAQAASMGNAGHSKAVQQYTWSAAAQRFQNIVAGICIHSLAKEQP
ncbi:glycosyltransferase family 4 protein [Azospirillum argentinense]